jgi:hypothetical protein
MTDNTTLNVGLGGDQIRTAAKTATGGAKTQVVLLDLGGGADSSPEAIVSGGTMPVSATSLPLPAGAAQEAGGNLAAAASSLATVAANTAGLAQETGGNLAAVAAAAGTTADTAYGGSGTSSIIAAAKGVYALLAGTLTAAITKWGGATLGAATSWGTAPSGNVAGVNANVLSAPSSLAQDAHLTNVQSAPGTPQTAAVTVQGNASGVPIPVSGAFSLSNGAQEAGGNLAALANAVMNAQQPEAATPLQARLVGNPDGDFAGVDLVERLMDPSSGEAASVRLINGPLADINGASIPSDAPMAIPYGPLPANASILIDTAGYSSVNITTSSVPISAYYSNDKQSWGSYFGFLGTGTSGPPASMAIAQVTGNYTFPVMARYLRIYSNGSQASGIVYLRSAAIQVAAATVGSTAVGAATTSFPVSVSGQDTGGLTRRFQTDVNGNLIGAGVLPPGWSFGNYNVSYTPYTTAAASLSATLSTINPVMVGGGDTQGRAQRNLLSPQGSTMISQEAGTAAGPSVAELLNQLLAVEKVRLQIELERARIELGISDDAEQLIADAMNLPSLN